MKLILLRSLLAVLGFMAVVVGYAQFNLSQPIPKDPSVRIGKLPNGLTYYIRQNKTPEKKIELRLAVNAGSVLEDKDQRGLAHFMEHMNFNGSKHFPKNELVNYLQTIGVEFGADLNAYTSFDETVYMLPISSDDPKIVEQGFTVLEDWAFNNLLDKSEIDKERGVVLEESRLSKGSGNRLLQQYLPRLVNGSLYAERLPIGRDSVLKTFNYATLEKFYKQWYRPNLMAVVVVGDIDPAVAEQKIKAHFSSFKNSPTAKARPAIINVPARTKPEAMVLTDEEATQTVVRIFNYIRPSKPVKTWADYRQSMVQELVNSIINQRLQELTQKENPPFAFGYAGTTDFLRGHEAQLTVAALGNGTTKEAVDALIGETERARRFGFLASELTRAKADMLNNAEREFNERDKQQSRILVTTYVNSFLQSEPVAGAENEFKFTKQILPGISLAEVNASAQKMAPSTNAFAYVEAPANMKNKLPTSTELLSEVVAAAKQPIRPYEEKAIAGNLMDEGPVAGKINTETKNARLGTTDLVLSNGVTITVKPTTFKNDQIVMDGIRKGGWHRYPLEKKWNAEGSAQMVSLMGVKDMSPTDLKKFLSGKTLNVTPYVDEDEEGVRGSSSVKDFETFLTLVNLYFTQPRKDEGLVKAFVSNMKGILQYAKDDPNTFFMDTVTKVTYNNSPWVTAIPTPADLDKLNVTEGLAIYKDIFGNADGMHFSFVGNIDVDKAKPLFEKYLGSLPSQSTTHDVKDVGVRPVKGVVNVNVKKGKEAQSLITITWSGDAEYKREENYALRALIDVLNITIIEKLREELGGMYSGGLNGGLQKHPYAHYNVSAEIPCGPENVDKLTAALFNIIKDAQAGNIKPSDLDKVKETLKKQYRTNVQDNNYWLSSLSQAFINETNPENVLAYEEMVNKITVQDLQNAAKKYLRMDNYIKAVLYPENAKVEPGVKKEF